MVEMEIIRVFGLSSRQSLMKRCGSDRTAEIKGSDEISLV